MPPDTPNDPPNGTPNDPPPDNHPQDEDKDATPMSELLISPQDIEAALQRHISDFDPDVRAEHVGRISEVGDGIARVTGLPNAQVNELLEFSDGTVGLALNLDEETIGAVVLGSVDSLEEGQLVRATGRILSVPVGDGLLGRVVDPLGNPIDGKGPLTNV
jgi:F-type H+-transporting ATPase subunit alpha